MRTSPPPAKITRPKPPPGTIRRTRLFRILNRSRGHAVTWVAGPPGAGKTTFISSYVEQRKLACLWYQLDAGDADPANFFHYLGLAAKRAAPYMKRPLPHLTPEYLPSLSIFTRRTFEQFYQRLKPPAVVVFDNYQDVPADAPLHQIMYDALSVLPAGIEAIVLSRTEPPTTLARLRASGSLTILGWEDLKLTPEESREIARTRIPDLSESVLAGIHDQTQGWAAGLVLALARGQQITEDHALSAPQAVFDYFAAEIFEGMDAVSQQILLQCSFLPQVTTSQAEQLTKVPNAGHVLTELNARGYFTLRHASAGYQFHPLFRVFLLARARNYFDAAERLSIKRKAAALLQASGRTEDAAALLVDAEDWAALISLILREAQTLAAQGRSKTLEGWILAIPEDARNHDAWLLYWLGICRLAFDPGESRRWLERAFAQFKAGNDSTGAFLSWASIIDTFNYEWSDFHPLDHWIAVCEELLAAHPQTLPPDIEVRVAAGMLTAMTYRQPKRADLPQWAERVHRIVVTDNNVPLQMALGTQLIFYYLWVGDFSRIAVIIDALRPSGGLKGYDPLTRQNWYFMQAMHSWFAADWTTCLGAITDGVKDAEDSGIHLLELSLLAQGVFGGLSLNDPSVAESCLRKMSLINSPRLGDKALYQYQAASVAWYHGDLNKSAEHGRQAVRITEEMGWVIAHVLCLIDLSVTLFDVGKYGEADDCLARAMEIGRGMNGLEFFACLNGARFTFHRADEQRGFALLKQGLGLGAYYGFKNIPRWNDTSMARLLAKALERGIEPEYVRKLIRVRNLLPEQAMVWADHWPWPLRVYTLGRFRIVKGETPISVSGSVQQKPLALIKVLIALGGMEIAEEKITDALWPDADGDRARHSLKITVHRLRKLLGSDEILIVKNGLLTLDARRVWVDAWSFSHTLGALEIALGEHRHEAVLAAVKRILSLNQGAFLEAESAHWAIAARERLRGRFLRLVTQAAELLAARDPVAVIPIYEKALEIEPLAEILYQGLMRSYRAMERYAEGLAVYRRCCATLKRELDLLPSPATEALCKALQRR